jgi:trimethylamine:corrinoid methyltransferase-like protein
MKSDHFARPVLSFLTDGQIDYVHARSLEILRSVGVRVDSPRARKVLATSKGVRWLSEERACLEAELIEWAIDSAPATIDIYDRTGNPAFCLGADRTRFGVGVTNLYFQDPLTDQVSPFTRQDMRRSVRLSHNLPNFDLVSTIGIVQDYPPGTADLYAELEMLANTTKPLVILVSNEELYSTVLDLFEYLTGDLAAKPFVIPYLNPITPLIINSGTSDKLLETIARGLPVIYSNYSMAGMSTPITAAGTLILMNAELLAGLALAQLARPGTPVILSSLPAYFDMRTMQDFYDPNSYLINLACAEMMAHYRLPHAGSSGSGVGWGPDLVGGGAFWMSHLTNLLGKCGLAPFVGGNFGSKAFSPAITVYANEVIGQALNFAGGFELDDTSLGMDDIQRVGPGGNFLDTELTMSLFRKAYYDSKIFPRWSLERWEERGRPQIVDLLRQHTQERLANSQPPQDCDELLKRGEIFIEQR